MKRILFIMTICMTAFICLSVVAYADDECDHEWSDWTVTGTGGKCTSYLSRECGKCHITENEAKVEHDWSSWETDFDASCAYEGQMSRDCSRCDAHDEQHIPATGKHSWGPWSTTVGATIYNAGSRVHYCTECGMPQSGSIARLSPFARFAQGKYSLYKGNSMQMSSVLGIASGDAVKSWKTSKKKVVSVTKSGKIKAKKKGSAKITVTLKSGKKATCTIKVVKKPKAKKKSYGGSVYITRTGIRYHCRADCWGLRNANALYKVSLSNAKSRGLTKCQVCY